MHGPHNVSQSIPIGEGELLGEFHKQHSTINKLTIRSYQSKSILNSIYVSK